MDYLYENLGDERFQEFCNSLISKEFPNIQSFPVGQPDGGRDAVVYDMSSSVKNFNVFQVKFLRNPSKTDDIVQWLEDTIKKESVKVDRLIERGAKCYYLLTNLNASAHLDVGTKDRINVILEKYIRIPAICWWRDDLNTLFEKDPLFKWSFPQIINGQDIFNSILFNYVAENKVKRERVIKAYLEDQFTIDNEVKFKQINLQNKLLYLFTDVPIKVKKINEKNETVTETLKELGDNYFTSFESVEFFTTNNLDYGAAEFLLNSKVQTKINRILLEGGPGQGKSTISQFVCQVHRARLLDKKSDIELLSEKFSNVPVRLPFKIDLRDVASWVDKRNPYPNYVNEQTFDLIWRDALEAFFIFHIRYHSKDDEFANSDFLSICNISPVLFVFDGFDEIADISLRARVIDFINKGITRISNHVQSIQVIITSRPAAFSDSIGFSIDNYPHFELTDITSSIINKYCENWINASDISARDAADLKELISEKLKLPHLKDLAKSPMQLAILISLLRTKGQSLPNKRTSLYDSYIELFFDRESEKNPIILEKRDLIIDIHQYLAWILHSEAELYKNNGSIKIEDLHIRLKEYLNKEGHDPLIAEQLFTIMRERVCALVSRVQGTFEFEVQPLREYFCAKFLYKSAPHSSAGSIKSGTKPDRFHAVLRNIYWQNVMRFFAGCADVGELDMIIFELKELFNDESLKFTSYPQIITSQLLSDYVFAQKPRKSNDVLMLILESIKNDKILNQNKYANSTEQLILPLGCGRKEVELECFNQLFLFPNRRYSQELINIINNNSFEKDKIWAAAIPTFTGNKLTKWLAHGIRLKALDNIDNDILNKIIEEGDSSEIKSRIKVLIHSSKSGFLYQNYNYKEIILKLILDNELHFLDFNVSNGNLDLLANFLAPYLCKNILHKDSDIDTLSYLDYCNNFAHPYLNNDEFPNLTSNIIVNDAIDEKIKILVENFNEALSTPIKKFRNDIKYWDILVENGREVFNDNRRFYVFSTIVASVKIKAIVSNDFKELCNHNISLCQRIMFARYKSGNVKFWLKHFDDIENNTFVLLVFFTWATPKVIITLFDKLLNIFSNLNPDELLYLQRDLLLTTQVSLFSTIQQKEMEEKIFAIKTKFQNSKLVNDLVYMISFRFPKNKSLEFIFNNIHNYNGTLKGVLDKKLEYLILSFFNKPNHETLFQIKELTRLVNPYNEVAYYQRISGEKKQIPIEFAKLIMEESEYYPREISFEAEQTCRFHANINAISVGKIASNEKWFI